METSVVAEVTAASGNDRRAKRMLDDGKTSRSAIAKAANRAAAAAKNEPLIDKMDSGDLSAEQVDLIADTAAKTDGAAATDEDFIAKVANTDPDQAKAIADDFVAKRQTKDGVQTEHERQRVLFPCAFKAVISAMCRSDNVILAASRLARRFSRRVDMQIAAAPF